MTDLTDAPRTTTAADTAALADEVVALVRRWLTEAASHESDASATRLAGVLADPKGLDFTVGFVDGVVRPEDLKVAAATLARIAPDVPAFLPLPLRAAVRLGGVMAPVLPGVVVPIARRVLRQMVGHLVIDATDKKLGPAIAKIRKPGTRLNVNLLGEAVLGEQEAGRRLGGTIRLLGRDDVDYVSIKVSSTVAPHAPWAFEDSVADVVAKLIPLFAEAAKPLKSGRPAKFINLDMEEYKDLDLTLEVFMRLLDRPEFRQLEAGIVLQAYLPDALAAMMRLQEWAAKRRAHGGAGVKVRLVKGANLPMEQVEASLHGWPLATWGTKQDSDTNYKRVLDYALHPDRIGNVRLGVAGHNLFDLAYAWIVAGRRGVRDGLEFEMLLGMAQGQAEAVKREVGSLLLYTPVVSPKEFDVAIAYLIRRLEEGASQENFMSAVFELNDRPELFERERRRFTASLEALDTAVPPARRVADRFAEVGRSAPGRFVSTPDTDPSVAANRVWADGILSRIDGSTLSIDTVAAARVETEAELERIVAGTVEAGERWAELGAAERGAILHRAGDVLEERRAELIEVMAAEAGKTIDQADPEVSEAVDFAHYYAERGLELETVQGATFVPARLTLVTPPWNFPVAIPAGSALAALAAGSPVLFKPAGLSARSGALVAEALWAAGVPTDVLRLVDVDEETLGRQLVSHPAVDRVILTGAFETAELFRSFRPSLPLLAETSGKNAIIVTPSADLDLAVKDVAASAFGHAGQKCSAASLVVLVGSVASSPRFRSQLMDAISSLPVGLPHVASTRMGPLIEAPGPKLREGLTTLGEGESWLIRPRALSDDDARLWSPGLRDGVARGSAFHRTEYFGPILGIMTADTLDEAIDIVNEVDYGLTSGLHSLDRGEISIWLDRIEAGNLYVNRGITGAIVERQPFGGWKKSSVGAGAKAGGPNYLVNLGSWLPSAAPSTGSAPSADSATIIGSAPATGSAPAAHAVPDAPALLPAVTVLLAAARRSPLVGDDAVAFLTRAAHSDARVWSDRFGAAVDVSQVAAEHNVFRYRAAGGTVVRAGSAAPAVEVLRVVAAALRSGDAATVSVADPELAALLEELPDGLTLTVQVETDAQWAASLAGRAPARIRLIGTPTDEVVAATAGRPDVALWSGPVTEAGRLELLPFLREQAVSITAHRFGTPDRALAELVEAL
ncbi:proline dehydrogenase family protein [Herbiconiux flava]|uniref:L-glutamate gamma-semialdehyde dehydrogenase n=1 Tax=Herbiconiux flava TaxID=881268 RepID=A0A852SLT6_9MICO|nr:proline dehydrogenase family protein [Herbiconiux flava]NYD69399.1 RHH-type proline utilization regulon transcriptional repressor/proline dehydrogenase/delta 1-pyrroline-5-carboxylate dehydrogenase [Herbiconiux flava]GLK16144.1 1-pyrroline-5-carboxylate dehydrogenase [Herbiconiux flava]